MRTLSPILLLLSILLSSCAPASREASPEPASVTHTFIPSDAPLLNPERGFFTPYELPSPAGFSSVRITGNTLVHLNIRLDDWRETDIPQEILDGFQTNFDDIRDAGVKAIIRFSYNQGPYPDSEPDASKQQILRHIEQLTPLLQKNTDVIAWVEAGFIGAWGEWHTSTHGLDNLTDKRDILNAILEAIPNRYVQVRYPANIIEMYANPLEAAMARVAHHNDCFLSSDTDVGTYERDGVNTIVRDQAYLAELTRFTPMSGETCAPNPPRSECESAIHEMELLHFSAINEAYHKGIIRSWEDGGCLQEITDRMGYRLTLTSADFNEQVRPGGILNLTVNLQNTGFASIVNERTLYVVLSRAERSGSGDEATGEGETRALLSLDPRTWEPGSTELSITLRVPSNIDEGEYQLALWLPDSSELLREDTRFAIQFANENVWDESTGYNILGTITVDEAAGGSVQRGEKFEEIDSTSNVERRGVSALQVPAATALPASTELIFNSIVQNNAGTLVIKFEFVGDVASYNGFQVFLDVDQNSKTGMSVEGIGADSLLENDAFYSYTGSGSDWTWTQVDTQLTFSNDNQAAQWSLPRAALGDSANVDVVFQLVDTNWDTAFVTRKLTFTHK